VSKRNNVNPDHYKVAGRERPGSAVAKAPKDQADMDKQVRKRWEKQQEEKGRRPPK
jgi:hypothetical protein